jgi:signal transduction histidine kinase
MTETRSVARGVALAAIAVAATWHVLYDLTATVIGWPTYRWPYVAALAWCAVTGVIVLAGVGVLRDPSARSRPNHTHTTIGLVVLIASSVAVLVDSRTTDPLTDHGLFSLSNWGLPPVGWPFILLLWRYRLRWLIVTIGGADAIGLVAASTSGPVHGVTVARLIIVFWGVATLQLGFTLGTRLLIRTAKRAAEARAAQAELNAAREAAERVHDDRQRRYREIGQAVRELLGDLATGLDPADPQAQRRCAVEASRLRRLIAEHDDTPDPLLHELRACADLAERRHVVVTLESAGTPPRLPVQVRRALTNPTMHLLAAARTKARVTVVCAPDAGEVEVSVVADGVSTADGSSDGVEVAWSQQDDEQWVRARWRSQ